MPFNWDEWQRGHLAAVIDSADDAIISKTLDGIVTTWNRAAEKVFGYSAEEIIGKHIQVVIPEDRRHEEDIILSRIRKGDRIDHFETKRMRKDGSIIDVSVTISPIRDSLGQIIGASKVARDISDRKRYEQAERDHYFLGAIVESAEDVIISKTLNGIVTSWNRAAERIFGYSADEMIGQSITKIIPLEMVDEEPRILERLRRGERVDHYETKRQRKDGAIIDVSLTVSPVRDNIGRIIGISKIARDITESKNVQLRERLALEEAEAARRAAEDASRAKDDFLATVSHELRTPMTAILGWIRMLASGQLDAERQKKAIDTIDRNARSQAQLIEDLLDISRIISGRLRIDVRTVDLASVISAAVESVRLAAEAKHIRIHTVLDSHAGPVSGDSERLQQVVWNLLSNAVKFTPKDGRIQVELRRVDSQVELTVTDNGAGINPEFLPLVFNRFAQADSSITRSHGGLGMGLAIAKSIVELHGGTITAASDGASRGSRFTVTLPVSAKKREPGLQKKEADARILDDLTRECTDLVGVKVLVVDDEVDTCEMLRFLFERCGSTVRTANGAKEALEVLASWDADILISDISMPGIDGYELIRRIRSDLRLRIPAVALSALARIDDRVKALAAGFQMHIAKPVEPVELISIVAGLAGLRR